MFHFDGATETAPLEAASKWKPANVKITLIKDLLWPLKHAEYTASLGAESNQIPPAKWMFYKLTQKKVHISMVCVESS